MKSEPGTKYTKTDYYKYSFEKISNDELEKLREEATGKLQESQNSVAMRSCWCCNISHCHLIERTENVILKCFECDHVFYKGVDITVIDD